MYIYYKIKPYVMNIYIIILLYENLCILMPKYIVPSSY